MPIDDRDVLLNHLADQAWYVAALSHWARDNASDAEVLLRVRDEVFTLRETLDTLGVANATASNDTWGRLPHAEHRDAWPRAGDPA